MASAFADAEKIMGGSSLPCFTCLPVCRRAQAVQLQTAAEAAAAKVVAHSTRTVSAADEACAALPPLASCVASCGVGCVLEADVAGSPEQALARLVAPDGFDECTMVVSPRWLVACCDARGGHVDPSAFAVPDEPEAPTQDVEPQVIEATLEPVYDEGAP